MDPRRKGKHRDRGLVVIVCSGISVVCIPQGLIPSTSVGGSESSAALGQASPRAPRASPEAHRGTWQRRSQSSSAGYCVCEEGNPSENTLRPEAGLSEGKTGAGHQL